MKENEKNKRNGAVGRIQTTRVLKLTFKKVIDPFFAGNAAEVAFFLLLSFVPTTILLAQLLHLFTMSADVVTGLLATYLRADIADTLSPLFKYNPSKTFSVILVVLALWAGSKALFSLMRISNYAYKGGSGYRNPFLGYIRERIRAVTTIVFVLITLILALNILVFGEVIVRFALKYLNDFLGMNYAFSDVWYTVRWIFAFILYFFMVLAVYYMLPKRRSQFTKHIAKGVWRTLRNIFASWRKSSKEALRLILPGSVFAAFGMLLTTWLYAYYIRRVAAHNFNILYGGLSSVVLLLLWFYALAFILILGIQLNAAWNEERKRKRREAARDAEGEL
ncbi:MAG: YihY/virulence factor BrkB family protein [Clostridiales Family XIII bacterium]|jgi:membrane protein|nr:YihY/virulence factor BrkB family protein [Clostridiales Family XIII bacterium]